MIPTSLLAISLYVPDAMARALKENDGLRGLILEGVPELDFLPPPWWEGSHTARLGLISPDDNIGPGPAVERDF